MSPLTALAAPAALILDHVLGEPRRWHPLVGFGQWADTIETRLRDTLGASRTSGALAWCLSVLPWVGLTSGLCSILDGHWLGNMLAAGVLYASVGLRSLSDHAMAIARPLLSGDLVQARQALGYIVSRDTAALDESQIATGAVESVLENGCDAVFAALFWFALLGPTGAVLYRLSNTLDAMWGYKNTRYLSFGWAAARMDDVLNFIPARLTALGYALLGDTRTALAAWRDQGDQWKSPNAGPVMASGAGALTLQLGGAACYGGEWQQRPPLGAGRSPVAADIPRAIGLVRRTALLWTALIVLAGLL